MKNFHLIHNLYHALLAVYGEPVTFADVAIGDKPVGKVHEKIVDSFTKTEKASFEVSDLEGIWAETVVVESKGSSIVSIIKKRWDDGHEIKKYNFLEGMIAR